MLKEKPHAEEHGVSIVNLKIVNRQCFYFGSAAVVVPFSSPVGCGLLFRRSGGRGSGRGMDIPRSSNLPKIIFPAVVCRTEVTEMSIVFPIILRALSTTTIVPSSR